MNSPIRKGPPDIDFVILWVDGEDPEWRQERSRYATPLLLSNPEDDANGDCRYRGSDDLLRFWFRGVEKNAPWIRKLFFVSCGQVPTWLNTDHPGLQIVNHKDFIPEEYLPTFNCRPIQFNLHRIKDLSEHFVLFDDDVFSINPLSPDMFFRDGQPLLHTYLGYMNTGMDNWSRALWNDYSIVNRMFNIRKAIWENRRKWFNVRKLGLSYAAYNYLCFRVNKTLPIHSYGHLAHPQLKSTISEIWEAIPEEAHRTCKDKFRTDDQLSHYLFSAWNQACGHFSPVSINVSPGKFFSVTPDHLQEICSSIERKDLPLLCLNDSSDNKDAERARRCILESFGKRFPEKSSFEK